MKSIAVFLYLLTVTLTAVSQSVQQLEIELQQCKDSTERSKLQLDLATAYYNDGIFTKALNNYFNALRFAERIQNRRQIAVSYHGIGSVYMETEKFDEAIRYLEKAGGIFSELNENTSLGRVFNTLGNVYYLQIRDSISEKYYRDAIRVCSLSNDSACLKDAYKNLGALYFEMGNRGDTLKALSLIKKSLEYIRSNDTFNLFQSNLSLAELYTYGGFLKEGKAYLDFCSVLLPHVNALHAIDDYYLCLHQYHAQKGAFKLALDAYKMYDKVQDSILNMENAKQLDELNLRYETAEKEKQIELLKAQNKADRLTIVLIITLVSILAILSGYLFIRYRKKQLVKKEKELESQKEAERIRIARDMHDEIGAGLTKIVMRSSQVKRHLLSGTELKQHVVESLDKMEADSRQLSHNLGEIIWALNPKNDTTEALFAYLRNYAYDLLDEAGISCRFNLPEQIPGTSMSPDLRRNIFLIVKESLNNLVKYSQATEAEITIAFSENGISLTIKDNGVGMKNGYQPAGNGLENMKKRAEENGGRFRLQTDEGKGTIVLIEDLQL